MNQVQVCVFFPAWTFIWKQGGGGNKTLCKLSLWTIHLFPPMNQSVQRGTFYRCGTLVVHKIGRTWSFPNWGHCKDLQMNFTSAIFPLLCHAWQSLLFAFPSIFIMSFFGPSVVPQIKISHLKVSYLGCHLILKNIFYSFFDLSLINTLFPSKHSLPR